MTEQPLLADVDRLAVRLGVTLTEGTGDYARAEDALWSASTRARSITERDFADEIPDVVADVVLSAARRLYRNPDRFLTNQAGSFQATLAQSDFAAGDIFLPAEIAVLVRHRRRGVLTVSTVTREDADTPSGPWDPRSYVAAPVDGVYGDPFLLGSENLY